MSWRAASLGPHALFTAPHTFSSPFPRPSLSQGFQPAPLLSLRTLKADVVAGLKPGQGEALFNVDQNWLVNGKFGMIQSA